MFKYIFVVNSLTAKNQIYQLIELYETRKVNFIYNEYNNSESKLAKHNGWNYLPLIDGNVDSDIIITQILRGDYFKYLNDIKSNITFWVTDTRTYNRYKNKLKEWVPLFANLEGGNQHFYYTKNLIFIERDKLIDVIKREENFKNILDNDTTG